MASSLFEDLIHKSFEDRLPTISTKPRVHVLIQLYSSSRLVHGPEGMPPIHRLLVLLLGPSSFVVSDFTAMIGLLGIHCHVSSTKDVVGL